VIHQRKEHVLQENLAQKKKTSTTTKKKAKKSTSGNDKNPIDEYEELEGRNKEERSIKNIKDSKRPEIKVNKKKSLEQQYKEIEEKEDIETKSKQDRKQKAKEILNGLMKDWKESAEKRRVLNKDKHKELDMQKDAFTKNPWDKVIAGVAIKAGDYKGSKDISRFRQALLNKKLDEPSKSDF